MKFEDKIQEIKEILYKKKHRWENMLPNSMAWEDAEIIILNHVYNKWHLYDQKKSFGAYFSRLCHNQLINICKHSYLSYAKPCLQCPHNLSCYGMEENHVIGKCDITKSGFQSDECEEYATWLKSKKQAFSVKYPVSLENYGEEIATDGSENLDIEESIAFIKTKMKELLPPKQYEMFIMLHFENLTEEEVAEKAGYKTNETGRRPGYSQIAAMKKKFKEMVIQIIKEMDGDE